MREYNDIPIDEVPPRYRDDLNRVMDTFGDEDVSLIKQQGRGAESQNTAELEVHFHIGDVRHVHVHVEDCDDGEDDADSVGSILSRLLGMDSDIDRGPEEE